MENNKHTLESQMQSQKSNTYLIRLERYTNDLIQSTILMNSYCYEPKTKDLFELKNVLKEKFKQILQVNGIIKQQMHQKQSDTIDLISQIKIQIKNLDQLHQEIKEYCFLSQNDSQCMA